jgi:hypothetical protein
MRRLFATLGLGLLLLTGQPLTSQPCHAGWNEFWHRVHLDWHRNNAWPQPFVVADRASVCAPFVTMIDNGWRLQNTISSELFHPETQELNTAGKHLVTWIVTQAPEHRRTVHVLRGPTTQASLARLDSVQQTIASILPQGQLPPVVLTDTVPYGGTGEYYGRIERAVQQSAPSVQLPPPTGSNTP